MFAAAICVSVLLGALFWALPGRLCGRGASRADVLAGPGIVLAVWCIAACVFAQPGLAHGFDLFRLLAINGAVLWACGTVLLLRLRRGRHRTLWTAATLLLAAVGMEVFVGNAPYFATHSYQPVDLRTYLQDAPAAGEPISLNDEHSTLTFTGIHQPLYNIALDGVAYQYDGDYFVGFRHRRSQHRPAPELAVAGGPTLSAQPGAHAGFFRCSGYPDIAGRRV